MIFRKVPPCPALQSFVRYYLLVNLYGDFNHLTPYPARAEQALVFFARGYIQAYDPLTQTASKIAATALFGQQVSRLDFQVFAQTEYLMLMIVFQPGAMYRFLGFSSQELTREFCDAESVISSELQSVNDQIANARDYAQMIHRAETYLLGKLSRLKIDLHPIDRIGQLLLHNPSPFSLDWLAGQANLSPRQFERKFTDRIGIGPKLYSRISRFFLTLDYKERHPNVDWLTIALHFGYTDYYHLVKDFKQFAHVRPNLMLHEYSQRPEIIVNL
ncbi:helix-turn-helix domain-containing protein [Spirosoma endbachense]|uniref:Helix-turn-helix domain-containing protein n=1 Tax=Spirosoma endbachense TaxID=2666025 RepID=A0A6P1VSJ8_9BACT|nr:helix-turn-helix domain-containing protein [Spirosoma endbachense]QHV95665.1 helix-turn-helix domain-containing protein [Spirosoma endbachense]